MIEKQIISLWINGYGLHYIASKVNTSYEHVEEVVNRIIFHEEN